jgi:predicted nucleic acid-binding protein
MIVLDTNVLSAVMQAQPDEAVISWLDRQPPESVWTTSITVFEIEMGISLLAEGRKRKRLKEAFAQAMREDLEERILAFDETAAIEAAHLASDRHKLGRPVDFRDTQIAGIVIARRAALATRNVRHFEDLAVALVDPWAK